MQTKSIIENRVYELTDFLTQEECQSIIDDFKTFHAQNTTTDGEFIFNRFFKNDELKNKYEKLIVEKFENETFVDNENKTFKIIGITNVISITKVDKSRIVSRHRDESFENEKWKIFIYLNETTSGTDFWDNDEKQYSVNAKRGRAILFDMSTQHASQQMNAKHDEIKHAISLRLQTQNVDANENVENDIDEPKTFVDKIFMPRKKTNKKKK